MKVVKHKLVPPGRKVQVKCTFSKQHFQPASTENMAELTASRLWSTDVYEFQFFNRYLYVTLKQGIKKRLILNALSGRSWKFRQFNFVNLKAQIEIFFGLDLMEFLDQNADFSDPEVEEQEL